jgi:hypothetical protein
MSLFLTTVISIPEMHRFRNKMAPSTFKLSIQQKAKLIPTNHIPKTHTQRKKSKK